MILAGFVRAAWMGSERRWRPTTNSRSKRNEIVSENSQPTIDPAFLQLMQQHRGGECLGDLSAALREVNKAVQLTGKGGSVTLKIKIAPAQNINGAVAVEDDIKTTLPSPQKGGSLFYADENGTLLREDPKQLHMELRQVTGGPADGAIELRKVEA
jgi:hypothetical protein